MFLRCEIPFTELLPHSQSTELHNTCGHTVHNTDTTEISADTLGRVDISKAKVPPFLVTVFWEKRVRCQR